MAFTEPQKLSIAKILGITPTLLGARLTALGTALTLEVETEVVAEIARWETAGAGGKFVKLHPTESNFGVETNSTDAKADIRQNIAVLLEIPTYAQTRSIGTISISGGCY